MKYLKVVFIGALVAFTSISFAQTNLALTLGVGGTILSSSGGVHFGLNPSYNLNDYLAIEGQLSYIRVKGDAFLSGDDFEMSSLNALAGGRLYVLPSKFKVRPYINALVGIGRDNDIDSNSSETALALSAGAYCQIKEKFLIGFAAETYGYFIFKGGYQF